MVVMSSNATFSSAPFLSLMWNGLCWNPNHHSTSRAAATTAAAVKKLMTNFKSCCCRNFFSLVTFPRENSPIFFHAVFRLELDFFRFPKSVRISDRSSLGGKVELNRSSLTPASHLKKCWQCQDVESEVHFLVTRSYKIVSLATVTA